MTQRIALLAIVLACTTVATLGNPSVSHAASDKDSPAAVRQGFERAQSLYSNGNYFAAAAVFFNVYTVESSQQNIALAMVADSLIQAGLPNAAAYFYIKTLQSGNQGAVRRVLPYLPEMMDAVGGDLLRKYIVRHTSEADYDAKSKNHFFYFLGKDELLKDDPKKALASLSRVTSGSGIMSQTWYLRGTAYAMTGQTDSAISAFEKCASQSSSFQTKSKNRKEEAEDLEARCLAGLARSYYQAGKHNEAEETYDRIPKSSFVWTDILFEQAWNSYAKGDHNRALGKLVTYRSPSLDFVFNPEVEVLRAQSFLAMCVYDDVGRTVSEFNSKYANVGGQMKNMLETHDQNFAAFYNIGKNALGHKLHTTDMMTKALNRFVRGPYFRSIVSQEKATYRELARAKELAQRNNAQKFLAFIDKTVSWRAKTARLLGGLFVRNSMYDLYQNLLADLDRMSFIKLEMLNRTKSRLEKKQQMSEDDSGLMKRGTNDVDRRDYQYYWSFNGEFWIDELGDYVFSLESQCGA